MRISLQTKMLIVCFLCLIPVLVWAQKDEDEDLYSDSPNAEALPLGVGGVGSPQVIFSGTLDVRFVHTGEAISWKRGGRGLTRYGGIDTGRDANRDELGDQSATAFKLPQIILVADILFNENISGFLQFNYDDHYDTVRKNGRIGVTEAFIKYTRNLEPKHRIDARFGLLIPPISLEHPATGWNTRYTITPSALNTWVGEELRAVALETNFQYDITTLYSLDLMVAPFSENDPAGSILAWRGWALHDYQLTTGSRLKTQVIVPETIGPRGGWVEPFKEMDGKMGYYAKAGLNRAESWKIQALHYNNLGDQIRKEYSTFEYVWKTEFTNFSLEWLLSPSWTVLGQIMAGNTQMGDRSKRAVEVDFSAAYLLLSYANANHRLSGRYDVFNVVEKDEVLSDPNDQEGTTITVAYLYQFENAHLFGTEFLHVRSDRPGAEQFDEDDDPKDDLFQLMYRVIF